MIKEDSFFQNFFWRFLAVSLKGGVVLLLAVMLVPFLSAPSSRAETVENPVVVELFTSQGCSSCPTATPVMQRAVAHPSVIGISCHVTYWNRRDWADPLSQRFCTDRQFGYIRAMKARNSYTPQMVVNGRTGFAGNKSQKLRDAVIDTALHPIASIPLNYAPGGPGGSVSAVLPNLPNAGKAVPYTLWLFGFGPKRVDTVPNGENRGRPFTSINPATTLENVGVWDGRGGVRAIPLPEPFMADGAIGAVILAQESGTGPIVAAGRVHFNPASLRGGSVNISP